MVTLYITSSETAVGKTAICAGLGKQLMSDGKKMYMAGEFCCEVQLPEKQFENLGELRNFIKKHHGIGP